MTRAVTFDDFTPGVVLGQTSETYSMELAQCWQCIFSSTPASQDDNAAESAGMATVMMMRAYLNIVTPRPPGNVHARQIFSLQNLPRPGETVLTVVRCAGKELKRDRRYIDLDVSGTGEHGRALYTGRMKLIWAA